MNKISIKFIVFQMVFSSISLILIVLVSWDYSGVGTISDNLHNSMFSIAFFGMPILLSMFYNLVHLYNLNRLKSSDEAIVSVSVVFIVSVIIMAVIVIVMNFIECNWVAPMIVTAINLVLFTPQVILINNRYKKIPALKEEIKLKRNRDRKYSNFSKFE